MDDRFVEAVELFNAAEFFACHDVLEEIWSEALDDSRDFYQGLIHAAVSLFHFTEGNFGGARKMYDSTLRYLSSYPDHYGGVDLGAFRERYLLCFVPLVNWADGYPRGLVVDPETLPQLLLL